MMKNEYDKLFDVILSDSEEKENHLDDIFIVSEKHHNENPKTDLSTLKYFLPSKIREEFMGDMYELVAQMENEERKKHFIWFIILLQYIFVMFGQIMSLFQFNVNKEISNK